jgi:hypothetical protein
VATNLGIPRGVLFTQAVGPMSANLTCSGAVTPPGGLFPGAPLSVQNLGLIVCTHW